MNQLYNIVCGACTVLLTHATNTQDVGDNNKNFQRIRQILLKHNFKKNVNARSPVLPPSCFLAFSAVVLSIVVDC
jgi:hypothetical protein